MQLESIQASEEEQWCKAMSELIPGGVATMFTFAFLGYLWTFSFTWPLGVLFSVYVTTIAFALRRYELLDVYLLLPVAAQYGLVLAWLLSNASLLPALVPRLAYYEQMTVLRRTRSSDTDIDGGLRVQTYAAQSAAVGGIELVSVGVFALLGVYGEHGAFVETLLYGIPVIIVGVGLMIYGFYALFASELRSDRADARYIVYLLAFAILPPLAYIVSLPIGAFNILLFWVVLFIVTGIVVCIEFKVLAVRSTSTKHRAPLESDERYLRRERYPVRIVQRWVLVTALPIFIVFTVAWAVETFADDDVSTGDSLGAVGIAVLLMAIVSLFFGGLSNPARASGYYDATPLDSDELGTDELTAIIESGTRPKSSPPLLVPVTENNRHVSTPAAASTTIGRRETHRTKPRRFGVDLRPRIERTD